VEKTAMYVRIGISVVLLALAALWLWRIANDISVAPSLDPEGTVIFDQYQRSKDVLLIVIPLVTTVLGYWFGAAGKAKAEENADKAQAKADQAEKKVQGILDSSSQTGLLELARQQYPDAFGLRAPGT
jgi:hypothetical protein